MERHVASKHHAGHVSDHLRHDADSLGRPRRQNAWELLVAKRCVVDEWPDRTDAGQPGRQPGRRATDEPRPRDRRGQRQRPRHRSLSDARYRAEQRQHDDRNEPALSSHPYLAASTQESPQMSILSGATRSRTPKPGAARTICPEWHALSRAARNSTCLQPSPAGLTTRRRWHRWAVRAQAPRLPGCGVRGVAPSRWRPS